MVDAELDGWLGKLDRLVDPEDQRRRFALHRTALHWEPVERLPLVINVPTPPDWPAIAIRQAYDDPRLMLLRELGPVYASCQVHDDRLFMVRANYGVGILASLFGLEPLFTEDDTLPWFLPLGTREAILGLVERGLPSIPGGLVERVLATEAYYKETLARYDNLAAAVSLYHCDLQGPLDIAHLIWGPDIFLALHDCPDLVRALLILVTEAYLQVMALDKASIGEGKDICRHWAMLCRGGIVVREDTTTLLSADTYRDFGAPCTARLLAEWGGVVHFCGNGERLLPTFRAMAGLTGLNLGNPENYDLLALYSTLRHERRNIMGWSLPLTAEQRAECHTGLTLVAQAPDIAAARLLWQEHVRSA